MIHGRRLTRWVRRLGLFLFVGFVILPILAWFVAPPSTLMLGRWVIGEPVRREAVKLERMGRIIPRLLLIAEDTRFCIHAGVDWQEMSKVLARSGKEGPKRGASTLPMQVAKNLYLWPGRSYVRKGLEIPIAYWLSAVWSKRQMLEVYLNIAEWGDGIFGIESAAQYYFHRATSELSQNQAALLITALPDPVHRNPARAGKGHRALAARLLSRAMHETIDAGCLMK